MQSGGLLSYSVCLLILNTVIPMLEETGLASYYTELSQTIIYADRTMSND